jgi:hypothetical protein
MIICFPLISDSMAVMYFSIAAKQQDILAALEGVGVLVELVGVLIRVEDDVSSCDEVDLAGVVRFGEEESASSLDGWGSFSADGETEGSGERLSDLDCGIFGGGRDVHLGTSRADDLRLANFDVDVVDIMSGKDTLAASRDLDAILCREGARDNSHPYDNGRGRLVSVPHAN